MWKKIPNFSSYSITCYGSIMSHKKYGGGKHILTLTQNKDGYPVAHIKQDNGSWKIRTVHRLVMITYHPIKNPQNFVVNHLNGIKTDNRHKNLEWCTVRQNNEHAISNGFAKAINEIRPLAKLSYELANHIRDEYIPRKMSRQKLARKYGVSRSQIDRILANKVWYISG